MRWGRRILGWVWVASVAASTVLIFAAIALWIASSAKFIELSYAPDRQTTFALTAYGGRCVLSRTRRSSDNIDIFARPGWRHASMDMPRRWMPMRVWTLGFWLHADAEQAVPIRSHAVTVPDWFIASMGLPLPLIAIRRWRKKRRIARDGLCKVCGYDLRASGERCPECGTAIEVKHAIT